MGLPKRSMGDCIGDDNACRPWVRRRGGSVPRFGITGHVNLTPASGPLVYQAIVDELRPYAGPGLTGVSCIARGADAIFAQAVLDLGGRLEVLVPAEDYRDNVGPDYIPHYDDLLHRAASVSVLPFAKAGRDAYEAANHQLVDSSLDRLFAVWDGIADERQGNTASVVVYARSVAVPVQVLWPDGVARAAPG